MLDIEVKFLTDFTAELLRSAVRHGRHNSDRIRFPGPELQLSIKAKIIQLAAARGFYRRSELPTAKVREVLEMPGLSQAYALLADDGSRELFIKLLAYRTLGAEHVILPRNNETFWRMRQSIDRYIEQEKAITDVPLLGSLDLFHFEGLRLYAHRLNIEDTFVLQQYRHVEVCVHPGDVVIDAGACWGDTALYFAQTAERVICFECMPSNLEVFEKNLSLNPELAKKITVLRRAVWDQSQETLRFGERGPGSLPVSSGLSIKVQTQTIDDAASSLERVDFIKMDIEGSEPKALTGAEKTLRKYRPKLAISIYHDIRHFAWIPNWIHSLDLGYKFYLDHFTIHAEETVLFAAPR